MKAYLKLFGFGVIPAVIGYVINFFILDVLISLWFINIVFIIVWCVGCYKVADADRNPVIQTLVICVFGFLMLTSMLCQEFVFGNTSHNLLLSSAVISYFTPTIMLGFSIIQMVFTSLQKMWPAYIVSMLIMCVSTLIGVLSKCRNGRRGD